MGKSSIVRYLLVVAILSSTVGLLFAMPPYQGIKEPAWVVNARKAGMDSPKDGLIQQLRAKDVNAKISGSRSYPVVLGYFTDTASTYTKDTLQIRLFNTGTNVMSVNNYYRDMSYNAMSCSGSVASWVNSGHALAYFGNGANGLPYPYTDTIQSAYGFIKHTLVACDAAVDFSDPAYDQNSDGYVDVLWVVHAGLGGEEGSINDIWSHSWQLTSWRSGTGKIFTTNDPRPGYAGQYMKIDKYIIMPEKTRWANGSSDVDLIGCGVFCHEFGHALGLPDLYDIGTPTYYGGPGGSGLGNWSVMAGGSWGGNGSTNARPVALDVWSRRFLGWVNPTLVTNDNLYIVNSIMTTSTNSSYKLAKLGADTTKQYWLIENRFKNGAGPISSVQWDLLLYGQGLAIYHIDTTYTSSTYFNSNTVNCNSTDDINQNRPYGVAMEETDMTTVGYSSEMWSSALNSGEVVDVWNSNTQTSFDSNGTAYPVTYLNGTTPTTGGAHTLTAIRAIPAASAAMACSMFVAVPTGVEGQPEAVSAPSVFALHNAWPNPARGQVNFKYQLPRAARVDIKVYNVLGQTVKTFDLGLQEPGYYSFKWSDANVAEGVYFIRLSATPKDNKDGSAFGGQAGDYRATRKFVMVR
jgi:M6 family metalloprotease-like protein